MSDKLVGSKEFTETIKTLLSKIKYKSKDEKAAYIEEEKNTITKQLAKFCSRPSKVIEEINLFYDLLKASTDVRPHIINTAEQDKRELITSFLLEVLRLSDDQILA